MAYEALQLYPNAMVVGTHALIQERAIYDNLALVITDEQQRFGVAEREMLGSKGQLPHVLVMSCLLYTSRYGRKSVPIYRGRTV